MRKWNFVTLDEIAPKVVSVSAATPRNRRRFQGFGGVNAVAAVVVSAAIACGVNSVQLQPMVSGNSVEISVPTKIVESSHRVRPRFMDDFAPFLEQSFIDSNKAPLDAIAGLGSTLDVLDASEGVVTAMSGFDDKEVWKPHKS